MEPLETRVLLAADGLEPNDRLAEAVNLGTGDQQHDGLSVHEPGNQDWFRWTASADGSLEVKLLFSHSGGDLDLELYDAEQNLAGRSFTVTDNEQVELSVVADAAYFIRVFGFNNAVQSSYDLLIDGPDLPSDRLEPNDSFAEAWNLGVGDQSREELSIHEPGNDDWFRWTAPGDGSVTVDARFAHNLGDVNLQLLDEQQNLIAESSSTTDDEQVSAPVVADQSLMVRVFGVQGNIQRDYRLAIDGPDIVPDRFEPNNQFSQATDLKTEDQTHHELTIDQSGDEDWYRWTSSGNGTLTVDIGFRHESGDLSLELYRLGQNLLASSLSASDNEQVTYEAAAGETFSIRVFGESGAIQSDYTLAIDGPEPVILPDALEPNNSFAEARDLRMGDQARPNLTIHQAGDDDWFKWTASDNGLLGVEVFFTHRFGDVNVELYDAVNNVIARSTSTTDNESLSAEVGAGQKYVIRVFGATGQVQRNYRLAIDGPEILPDKFEPNDTFAEPFDLGTHDQLHTGLTLHESSNDDWYRWTPSRTGALAVDITFSSALGDLDLELYDDTETLLADSTTFLDSERVSWDVVAGQTYVIHVFGFGGTIQPSYDLSVNGPSPDPDPLEPNDSLDSAFDLGTGGLAHKGLTIHDTGNEDWYRWTAAADGPLSVDLLFSHETGDVNLEVYDLEKILLADSTSATDDEQVAIDVDAGQSFLIRVLPMGDSIQPHYDLVINGPGPPQDPSEPNDSLAAARDLGGGDQSLKALTIHGPNNDDWYKWTARAAGDVTVSLLFEHDLGDLNLQLLDADGMLTSDATSTDDNEQIMTEADTGQMYFIRVFGEGGILHENYDLVIESNDPPTISDLPDTVRREEDAEDTKLVSIPFVVNDNETPSSELTLTATSSNTTLVPEDTLVFGGAAAVRTVSMSPVPDQSGRTTITITVNDNEGGESRESFELVVDAVADRPNLAVSDARGEEDMPIPLEISASLTDQDGSESLSIRITGVPDGATLSSGVKQSDGAWLLTPADLAGLALSLSPHAAGDFPLQVTGISTESFNASGAQAQSNLLVSVDAVADVPNLVANDLSGEEDSAIPLLIDASLVDKDGSETLRITIAGVPVGAILSAGTDHGDGSWTVLHSELAGLTITPTPDTSGSFMLTLTAVATEMSNGDTAQVVTTAVASIATVNDAPTISELSNQSTREDTPTGLIPLTIRDVESAAESLIVTVTSDNQLLVPDANITIGGSGPERTVTINPAADQIGSAMISVHVRDPEGASSVETFELMVTSVNDPPAVTGPLGLLASDEDAPRSVIALGSVFGDPDMATASDRLTYSIRRNDNPTLVAASVSANTLILDLLEHQHGTATIVIRATDLAGLFVEDTLSLDVKAINDPPRITSSDQASVNENSTALMIVTASDPDGDVPTFAIGGGPDQARLVIDSTSGVLRFRSAPDFENPADADANNVYEVIVGASDGQGAAASQLVRITVTDVDETAPTVNIVQISPDIRADAVSQMTIIFSKPVTGFDLGDLSLTRTNDDTVSLLPATATLTTSDNVTWTLDNLGELTAGSGTYRLNLTAAGSGIGDAAGNLLVESAAASWTNGAGDANQDGRFDQLDVIAILQSAKYRTGQPATWSQGDWNGDGVFNQFDIIVSQQTQPPHYLAGPFASNSGPTLPARDAVFGQLASDPASKENDLHGGLGL